MKAMLKSVANITGIHDGIYGDVSNIRGDVSNIRGNVRNIRGDVSDIYGDVSNIRGDLDECEITNEDRARGIDINSLVNY